ncbi:MAG: L-fucose/L-arabinose isomerase family protein [Thermoguttaceae bacterium]
MDKLRVGFACCARLTFDSDYAQQLFERSVKALSRMDVELIHGPGLTVTEEDAESLAERFHAERVDAIVVQYGTFALGTLIPIFADRLAAPIVLWGVPEPRLDGPKLQSNSFCGINMNAHTLMRLGRKYDYIFCQADEAPEALAPSLRVIDCLRRLRRVRLGLVGYRVPGFYTSTFDELGLRRLLGVEVHHVTTAELFDTARAIEPGPRQAEAEAIRRAAGGCDATEAELDQAGGLMLAFRQIAAKERLAGFAVKCWPEFTPHYGIMPCSTISRLNDEGLLTACEGDIYGTVTMLMANYLSGRPAMFADFIAIDEDRNEGLAWHCGSAATRLMAQGACNRLGKHATVEGGGKRGVTVNFPIAGEGPVTMARLGVGPGGMRLFFAGGQSVPTRANLPGNSWSVRFDAPIRRLVDTIIGEGLEHHTALVQADIRDDLRRVARWLDLETLDVDACGPSLIGKGSR